MAAKHIPSALWMFATALAHAAEVAAASRVYIIFIKYPGCDILLICDLLCGCVPYAGGLLAPAVCRSVATVL